MKFSILDFGSADKLAGKLELGAEQAIHTLGLMTTIEDDMLHIEEVMFDTDGRRGGGSWKQLNENTIKRKGSSEILRDTGALYESLTKRGAEFQILETTNEGILFGTDRPWAAVHQHGSRDGHIPARPMLRFLPSDINRWTEYILYHMAEPFAE